MSVIVIIDFKWYRLPGKQNRAASAEYLHIPVAIIRQSVEDVREQRGFAAHPWKWGRGGDLYGGSPPMKKSHALQHGFTWLGSGWDIFLLIEVHAL